MQIEEIIYFHSSCGRYSVVQIIITRFYEAQTVKLQYWQYDFMDFCSKFDSILFTLIASVEPQHAKLEIHFYMPTHGSHDHFCKMFWFGSRCKLVSHSLCSAW